jgi:hypothetical protein
MPVDERTRRTMGESLVRVHGEEVADAIMAHLPPVTYGELATKQDLREAMAELRAEMHQGFAEIQKQIADIQKQIAGVHKNISRATLSLLVGLLGAPLVDELAKRLF